MQLLQKTPGSSTSYMLNCSQIDVSAFRKLIAQWTKKMPPTHGFSTHSKDMKHVQRLHLHPPTMYSPATRFIWNELYTETICSVLKQAPELPMPSLWHRWWYKSHSSTTGVVLLGGTPLAPHVIWPVCCLQRKQHALAGMQQSQILWPLLSLHCLLFCHLPATLHCLD